MALTSDGRIRYYINYAVVIATFGVLTHSFIYIVEVTGLSCNYLRVASTAV